MLLYSSKRIEQKLFIQGNIGSPDLFTEESKEAGGGGGVRRGLTGIQANLVV